MRSAVGFPIEGAVGGDPNGSQRFSAGYLATNAAGTAAIVGGTAVPAAERKALIDKWRQSIPGKQPAHDTVWTGSGAYFKTDPDLGFDKTFTIKAGASTAYYVKGPIQDRYHAEGAWDGPLGWPTSDESCLDVPCRYSYSNFERGHIRWAAGPDRAQVATVVAGAVPSTPRRIVFDPDLGKETFSFTLSRSLQAESGAPDGDQDGLDDDAEKQLAFLTAPRIFWDEEESSSENQDFVFYRRLDMVQVRPRSANVSRWTPAQGRKWITIRFMMAYPEQYTDFSLGSSHIGDSEMFELRLYSAAGSGFSEWRIGEFVFPPHGGDLQYYGDVGVLAARAKALGTAHIWIATDEDGHGSWGGSETTRMIAGWAEDRGSTTASMGARYARRSPPLGTGGSIPRATSASRKACATTPGHGAAGLVDGAVRRAGCRTPDQTRARTIRTPPTSRTTAGVASAGSTSVTPTRPRDSRGQEVLRLALSGAQGGRAMCPVPEQRLCEGRRSEHLRRRRRRVSGR